MFKFAFKSYGSCCLADFPKENTESFFYSDFIKQWCCLGMLFFKTNPKPFSCEDSSHPKPNNLEDSSMEHLTGLKVLQKF